MKTLLLILGILTAQSQGIRELDRTIDLGTNSVVARVWSVLETNVTISATGPDLLTERTTIRVRKFADIQGIRVVVDVQTISVSSREFVPMSVRVEIPQARAVVQSLPPLPGGRSEVYSDQMKAFYDRTGRRNQ